MKTNFLITTPIYYASGKPHIGHAYTTILADVIKGYKKILGVKTCFLTGMDEHGQKIQEKAKSENKSPQEFVDSIFLLFIDLWKELDIEYDVFVRTTNLSHKKTLQEIFSKLYSKNLIYLDKWTGYYCPGCEENKLEKELIKVSENELKCQIGHTVQYKNEESYFYKMSQNSEWLLKLYNDLPNFIYPEFRKKELINNFISNLNDLSISRTSIDWGIKIIENNNHSIYVWLDALFSYLTGLGFLSNNDEKFKEFWENKDSEIVHLMSKEITRFHCIYWPIFLKDMDLRLPSTILSHGWIITKEGKMSKSLGNVIDPKELISKYGSDALRYFLMKEISITSDGVFDEVLFAEIFNSDLANNIGNLCSRTIGMLKKYNNGYIYEYSNENEKIDKEFFNILQKLKDNTIKNINEFNISQLIKEVINLINYCNKLIEDFRPWNLFNQNNKKLLNMILSILVHTNFIVANLLEPILKKGSIKIKEQLNINKIKFSVDLITNLKTIRNITVNDSIPIYNRINFK